MRLLALSLIAACALVATAQAQVGQQVIISHEHNTGSHMGNYPYGCCDDDNSFCFNIWSNYCAERKPRGACLLGGHAGCGTACGCNDHCGIFQNRPCKFPKFKIKKHVPCEAPACEAPACEEPACEEPGCDVEDCAGCDTTVIEHANGHAVDAEIEPSTEVTPEEMPASPIDSARSNQGGTPLMAPGATGNVKRPVAPPNHNSAGRWYLPFKWKK